MYKDIFDACLPPPHPGEILREDIFPQLGMTRTAFARHLGISPARLREVMSERASVTVDLAHRLGAALGSGAQFWLGLQTRFDLWHVRQETPIKVKPLKLPDLRRPLARQNESVATARSA
jgi:addiction module HigA family antidote